MWTSAAPLTGFLPPCQEGVEFCTNEDRHGADCSHCSPHPIIDTAGTSDLKEIIQIIAAHVKAIRRLRERFSIWHPEASKSYRERHLEGTLPSLETRKVEGKHLWQPGKDTPLSTLPLASPGVAWRISL